nr:BREX-2 system adenine-specific DNA-methyltransferase PglX [Nocardia nova]
MNLLPLPEKSGAFRWLWPARTTMGNRATFSKGTYFSDGRQWYEWHQTTMSHGAHPWTITFAEVATHNHFALDRGGKVFKQTAPVIKLPQGASEDDHLNLLGLLNSSTACFWLKMVCHKKGGSPESGGGRSDQPWSWSYQFNSTNVEDFPIPSAFPSEISTEIDALAQQLTKIRTPWPADSLPSSAKMRELKTIWDDTRARLIALQEELDWQVYGIYGLTPLELCATPSDVPDLAFGERAFEIVLARRVLAGEAPDDWFTRHGATPATDVPDHWPDSYKDLVRRRIDTIESNSAIGMIERPDYKRRWATAGWDQFQEKALRSWLLGRMESRSIWCRDDAQPRILTLARLTDLLAADDDFVSVAALHSPRAELAQVVATLITDQHVPFISALRYKPSGLRKRQDWEHVWDMQRQEDAMPDGHKKNEFRKSIPVPPKYTNADFLRTSFWQARGKLDVPKERFISYGSTNAATPDLYGWAGWDHREQAMAIAIHLAEHSLSTEEITPFLAGLLELQPWLDQWHNDIDPDFGISPAEFLSGDRRERQAEHGLTDDDLRNWRPQPVRGRRAAATRTPKATATG